MYYRAILLYFLGFFIFVGFGYKTYDPDSDPIPMMNFRFSDSDFDSGFMNYSLKNYATAKQNSAPIDAIPDFDHLSHKYEKVSSMGSTTSEYAKSLEALESVIKESQSLVQFEENSGLKGQRKVKMAIGVHPFKFEETVEQLKQIGDLKYFRSDVTDKTNEFRQLQAKRNTLKAHLKSLEEFKNREGEINDLLALQNKILGVQQELQGLGVSLGDFDSENEFCTVKLSIREIEEVVVTIDPWERIGHAFTWAMGKYSLLTILAVAFAVVLWLLSIIFKNVNGVRSELES